MKAENQLKLTLILLSMVLGRDLGFLENLRVEMRRPFVLADNILHGESLRAYVLGYSEKLSPMTMVICNGVRDKSHKSIFYK